MNDCENPQDDQSRFRIGVSDTGNYNWKVQNLDYGIVREICLRLAMYLRYGEVFDDPPHRYVTVEDRGFPMIALTHYPYLGDVGSICVVYEPWSNAIQASINGLETMEALIALEDIAHIVSLMRFPPERIPEIS